MKIRATVGVCLRNCERAVRLVTNIISSQDFPHENLEVIFVDDGSQDNTLNEILKIAPTMNIKYKVFHHTWKGLGYSRNVVLSNTQGDYIVWIDDGTIIPKDYVRKQVDLLEKEPNLGIIRGFIGAYSGSNRAAALENMGELVFSQRYAGKTIAKRLGTSGSIFRVKAAKQVGGFDEALKGASEDSDIFHRILSTGWQIHITNIEFSIEYNQSFKNVWRKSFWYGYGDHFFMHKHKELSKNILKITPLAGFLEGMLNFSIAFRLTNRKLAFMLPVYNFSKRILWCLGFIKSHFDAYGHSKKSLVS